MVQKKARRNRIFTRKTKIVIAFKEERNLEKVTAFQVK